MSTYVLSDGIKIETVKLVENGGQSTTGYLGASFSDKWAMSDFDKLFTAASTQLDDPVLLEKTNATLRTAWHGGKYSDPREAAYVVALMKHDPASVIDALEVEKQINGCNAGMLDSVFPTDLYDLPVFFTHKQAVKAIKRRIATGESMKAIDNRMVDGNRGVMGKKYGSGIFKSLAETFGRDTVHRDIQKLTINEFQLRYGLRV